MAENKILKKVKCKCNIPVLFMFLYRRVLKGSKAMKLATCTALDNILITGIVLTNVQVLLNFRKTESILRYMPSFCWTYLLALQVAPKNFTKLKWRHSLVLPIICLRHNSEQLFWNGLLYFPNYYCLLFLFKWTVLFRPGT